MGGAGGRGEEAKKTSILFLYAGCREIGNVRGELKRGLGEQVRWRRYQKPLYCETKEGGGRPGGGGYGDKQPVPRMSLNLRVCRGNCNPPLPPIYWGRE